MICNEKIAKAFYKVLWDPGLQAVGKFFLQILVAV